MKQRSIEFTSILERSNNKLWGAHFRVPRLAAKSLIEGKSRRVLCSLNNAPGRQCALVPFGDGSFVITVNKPLRESLGLKFGSRIRIVLRKDRSKYGLPMPEEMQEAFRQDQEGDKLFHALTPGRQRTLLYIVNSGKGIDERIFRAISVIRHLKETGGKINYRKLNTLLRKRAHNSPSI